MAPTTTTIQKVRSGSAVATDIANSLKNPETYINLAQVVVKICEHMEQFPYMSGEDKKVLAMEITRKVYASFNRQADLNENILSDFIDVIISISRGAYLFKLALEKGKSKCSCCFGGGGEAEVSSLKSTRDTRSLEQVQRDMISDAQKYFNLAKLVQKACEFMEDRESMTGAEKKAKATEMIKLVLSTASQSGIDDRMISDFIEVIIAVSRGLQLAHQAVNTVRATCCK